MSFPKLLARHDNDPTIMFAGDWHGRLPHVQHRLNDASRSGARLMIQMGDLSLWPGFKGKRFISALEAKCNVLNMDIISILGNHEDWHWLDQQWKDPRNQENGRPKPLKISEHIWVLPKGYSFSLNGVSFLSLGGAASVDYDKRKRDKDWWPQEMISLLDVEYAKSLGHHDVMLTHESPNYEYAVPAVQKILDNNPRNYRPEGLAYSTISRQRVTDVLETVQPRFLVHAHMHIGGQTSIQLPKASHQTEVLSLHQEFSPENLFEFSLEKFKAGQSWAA